MAFENEHAATGRAPRNEMPRMHPVTQKFADSDLEQAYRRVMRLQTWRGTELGLTLAIVLFAAFGLFDLLLGAQRLGVTWSVRAMVILAALLVLRVLPKPRFRHRQEGILLAFCLLMTFGLAAIVAVVDTAIADRYYVGFLLIAMASYLMIGVSFASGTLVALTNIVVCIAGEAIFHRPPDLGTVTNGMFLVSGAAIAAVGAWSLGMQRRLAFHRGHLLEARATRSEHSALHDPLTALPNRRLLLERLTHAIARDGRFGKHAAVLFLDLDGFKAVNDTHGHNVGDELLRVIASRLSACVRETDTVARLGGDEFVILLEDLADPADIHHAQQRISACFSRQVEVDGLVLDAGASLGIAVHPGDGDTAESLLNAADAAMYRQKLEHRRNRIPANP